VLIGTGSEVQHCAGAAERLAADGLAVRVVSMPSWERFSPRTRTTATRSCRPRARARVAVEAGVALGWERWVGEGGAVVGLDRFGASAPAERLFEEFGFTADHVAEVARGVLGRVRG
jgi:transketolase